MGLPVQELEVTFTADTKKAESNIKRFDKSLDSTEKQTLKLNSAFLKNAAALGGITLSVAAAVRAGQQAVRLWQEQELAVTNLNAALEVTGQFSQETSRELQEFASELQGITTVGDETSLQLLQVSLSMGATSDQARDATRDAIGLSRAFGISLQTAVRATTAAQQGNFDLLQRYAPSIRNATTEADKAAEAQRLLASSFAVATAEAQTAFGVQTQLSNAWGDTQEIIGRYISGGLQPLQQATLGIINRLNEWLEREERISEILDGESTGSVDEYREALDRLNRQIDDTIDSVVANTGATREQAQAWVEAEDFSDEYVRELIRQRDVLEGIIRAQGQYVTFQDTLNRATGGAIEDSQRLTDLTQQLRGEYALLVSELTFLDQAALNNLISEEERYQQKLDERQKFNDRILENFRETGVLTVAQRELLERNNEQIAAYEEILERIRGTQEDVNGELSEQERLQRELAERVEKRQQDRIDSTVLAGEIEAREARRRLQEQREFEEGLQRIQDRVRTIADLQTGFTNAFGDLSRASTDARIADIERERDAAVEAARSRGEDTAAIEEEFNNRVSRERTKQAQQEKALRIFDSIINTSAAIVEALPNIPLSVAVGALGAAQTAAIAAQPIPSFQTGTPPGGYVVPPGFDGDNFPVLAQTGERVTVTPAGQDTEPVTITLMLDSQVLARTTTDLVQNRQIVIRAEDVVA